MLVRIAGDKNEASTAIQMFFALDSLLMFFFWALEPLTFVISRGNI